MIQLRFFFFSSRRRHTRFDCDWSSDVCSSDLFGPQLPRILAGTAPSLAIDDLQAFGLRAPQPAARDRLTRAFEELYAGSATGLLSTSSREAFDAVQMLKRLDPGPYRPANGADYPPGRLGKALPATAPLIKAEIESQVAFA